MADVHVKMNGDGDSSAKCREARRRRIEMRRLSSAGESSSSSLPPVSTAGSDKKRGSESPPDSDAADKRRRTVGSDPPAGSSPSSSSSGGAGSGGGSRAEIPPAVSGSRSVRDPRLGFGSVSLFGRLREMEDFVSVRPWFFRPAAGAPPLHFFAVFDGHGGSNVSAMCKDRMHVLLLEELAGLPVTATGELENEAMRTALRRCFRRMDELALAGCVCGRVGRQPCGCARPRLSEFVGSTAVVALVGRERIVVANCGDSRAVLSRGGRAVPMSVDHKPDRPDELARIQAAGGRVIYQNGARVDGILAMSRAIGDKHLKPVVTSEPEIRIVERQADDDCLILASDGLWDVIPNDLACSVARRCLAEVNQNADDRSSEAMEGSDSDVEEEDPSETRCNLAAALLARLALGRRSADNISVIVIDLKSG